jgi:hypothetical protein
MNAPARRSPARVVGAATIALGGALTALACSSAPTTTSEEAAGVAKSALGPQEIIAPTTYYFQLDAVEVLSAIDPAWDSGYSEWAELGARVNNATPSVAACNIGDPSVSQVVGWTRNQTTPANAPLSACLDGNTQDGVFQVGKPLRVPVTVTSPTDVVHLAFVLDNVASASAGNVSSALPGVMAAAGDATSGAGNAITLLEGSAATGAAWALGPEVGVVAAGISVVADILSTGGGNNNTCTCAGGLLGTSGATVYCGSTGTNTPDTLLLDFPAAQLDLGTQAGVMPYVFDASVGTNPDPFGAAGACYSHHRIHLSISRDINTGLAPSPKSADSAVARLPDRLDVFRPHSSHWFSESIYWNESGWQSRPMDGTLGQGSASNSYAAVSRSPEHVDVFWADGAGNLMTSAWSEQAPFWATTQVINYASAFGGIYPNMVPAYAPLTAVANSPLNLDVFFVDTHGAIEDASWSGGAWSVRAITGPGVAQPGAPLAAVGRTAENLDVFFVGKNDGAIWTAYTYPGMNGRFVVNPISPPGLATTSTSIAATARSSVNIDLFFVGNDGWIWSSAWTAPGASSTGAWSTFRLQGTSGECDVRSSISAVSMNPTTLDVVCVGRSILYQTHWGGAAWSSGAIPGVPAASPVGLSIVARTSSNLDVFFNGANGALYTAHWAATFPVWGFTGPLATASGSPPLVTAQPPISTYYGSNANAPETTSAFFVGADGVIYEDYVVGASGTWSRQGIGSAPIGATVAVGARDQFDYEAFYADPDGAVRHIVGQHSVQTGKTTWLDPPLYLTPLGVMPPGGAIATASQSATQLDAFFVDNQGRLQVAWTGAGGGGWGLPAPISSPGFAPPGARLLAATQGTQLDLFLVDNTGTLGGYFVNGAGAWQRFTLAGGFRPGGAVAARVQNGTQLDVVAIDSSGSLRVFWVVGTGAWSSATLSNDAIAGAPVALGTQNGAQLDALYVDRNGALQTYAVTTGPWFGPFTLAPSGTFAPGAPVSAAPQVNQLDAFVPGTDGTMKVLWVNGTQPWAGPASLP